MSGNVSLILTLIVIPAVAVIGAVVTTRWVGHRDVKLRAVIWATTLVMTALVVVLGIGIYAWQNRDYRECISRSSNGSVVDSAFETIAEGKSEVAERFTNIENLIAPENADMPIAVEFRALAAAERALAEDMQQVAEAFKPVERSSCVKPLTL